MAYNRITNLMDQVVETFNPTLGSSSGSKAFIVSPVRGLLTEVGFMPSSTLTSNTTLAADIVTLLTSTTSLVTAAITSTLGTFGSLNLFDGAIASVNPPSPVYVNPGDLVRLTTSGGQTSLVGGTLYGIFRKG